MQITGLVPTTTPRPMGGSVAGKGSYIPTSGGGLVDNKVGACCYVLTYVAWGQAVWLAKVATSQQVCVYLGGGACRQRTLICCCFQTLLAWELMVWLVWLASVSVCVRGGEQWTWSWLR